MTARTTSHSARVSQQQGAALLVALVLLVAVTLLGVSAMQGTILQERMSANQRDVEEAFNVAENAMRRGEQALMSDPASFLGNDPLDSPEELDLDSDNVETLDDLQDSLGADIYVQAPLYHIAKRGDICSADDDLTGGGVECDEIFSVTARGTGRTTETFVVLQSTVRVPE
ncbi:hypothetical protein E4656_16960 [Natronospirillum operosum]|uniref:Type 4 fimbrial biogenesis protein PilX N-terminal domain-containing protein n=1 Tax=Natronospirillum operosum TaxID=2759953 RepID=A0A4Z0W812_9GAMM|nr:PilX N-terminal domain-containing pilus assembly protein [Natronospirillum operosum]TGG91083.1 hypothetical protein E4656_16960 [Natronospirillum operosum]